MSVAVGAQDPAAPASSSTLMRTLRRNAWVLGLWVLLGVMLLLTRLIQPDYGAAGIDSLARAALPVAFAAVAQAVVVIAGGIDLSVGSMMALTNVAAAVLMKGAGEEFGVVAVVATLALGRGARHRQRRPRGHHPGAGHRGHARDVVRVGGRCAAGPQHPRR